MPQVQLLDRVACQAWVEALSGKLKRPGVVLLSGDLGAGKTQFVRWFLHALGATDSGASPTFAIHQAYSTPSGPVDHVDLYRLTSDADLESSGFWDLLTEEKGLLFVEWAERLPREVWPAHWQRVEIHLSKGTGEARTLNFSVIN